MGCSMLLFYLVFILQAADGAVSLKESDLTESSGICWSEPQQLLWTHNDSGDRARIFAFELNGKKKAEVLLEPAKATDWEDICYFQGPQGRGFLAIADVGDNLAKRPSVTIYLVAEEDLKLRANKVTKVKPACKIQVQYDTGSVNCESLAYDPITERFILCSKERFSCRLSEFTVPDFEHDHKVVAKSGQRLLVPLATGADISPSGDRLVISTYGPAMLYERELESGKAGPWRPAKDPALAIPARRQGESICFAEKESCLLLTSEFAPTPLIKVPLPAEAARKNE